ncbi:MAG: FAD:protein FMN transferase [Verrucomicrobiaceae bacterium]|nr:FAD:protein FMN transferase [Verrucomicrobiaceae bacterium]
MVLAPSPQSGCGILPQSVRGASSPEFELPGAGSPRNGLPQNAAATQTAAATERGLEGWTRAVFPAMGTHCQIIFRAPSSKQAAAFREAAISWVQDFENKYSRFKAGSLISEINRSAGSRWVEIDAELDSMLSLCDWYHWSTGGVFDPTALPLMQLWDYHAERPVVPGDDEIARALDVIGWSKVEKKAGGVFLPRVGMSIDLGGIGKEYAVDRVLEMSARWGMRDIMVDFGRDIRVHGESPHAGGWRVGLEHPHDPGRCWGGVLVKERAVATSGDYLRGFDADGRRYGHIIDPRTGRPVENGCNAATVIAQSCTEAGVLSTAALVLGQCEGLALIAQSCLAQGCVWRNGERRATARFDEFVF